MVAEVGQVLRIGVEAAEEGQRRPEHVGRFFHAHAAGAGVAQSATQWCFGAHPGFLDRELGQVLGNGGALFQRKHAAVDGRNEVLVLALEHQRVDELLSRLGGEAADGVDMVVNAGGKGVFQ